MDSPNRGSINWQMSWRHQGCEFIYFHILLCVVDVQYQFTPFLRTYKTGTWKIDLIAMSPFMALITGNDCQPCLVQYIWKPMHTACPLPYLFGLWYQSIWVADITHTFQDCFTPTVAIILTTTPAPIKLYKGIWVNEPQLAEQDLFCQWEKRYICNDPLTSVFFHIRKMVPHSFQVKCVYHVLCTTRFYKGLW